MSRVATFAVAGSIVVHWIPFIVFQENIDTNRAFWSWPCLGCAEDYGGQCSICPMEEDGEGHDNDGDHGDHDHGKIYKPDEGHDDHSDNSSHDHGDHSNHSEYEKCGNESLVVLDSNCGRGTSGDCGTGWCDMEMGVCCDSAGEDMGMGKKSKKKGGKKKASKKAGKKSGKKGKKSAKSKRKRRSQKSKVEVDGHDDHGHGHDHGMDAP